MVLVLPDVRMPWRKEGEAALLHTSPFSSGGGWAVTVLGLLVSPLGLVQPELHLCLREMWNYDKLAAIQK